jgi:hypothetical protein
MNFFAAVTSIPADFDVGTGTRFNGKAQCPVDGILRGVAIPSQGFLQVPEHRAGCEPLVAVLEHSKRVARLTPFQIRAQFPEFLIQLRERDGAEIVELRVAARGWVLIVKVFQQVLDGGNGYCGVLNGGGRDALFIHGCTVGYSTEVFAADATLIAPRLLLDLMVHLGFLDLRLAGITLPRIFAWPTNHRMKAQSVAPHTQHFTGFCDRACRRRSILEVILSASS